MPLENLRTHFLRSELARKQLAQAREDGRIEGRTKEREASRKQLRELALELARAKRTTSMDDLEVKVRDLCDDNLLGELVFELGRTRDEDVPSLLSLFFKLLRARAHREKTSPRHPGAAGPSRPAGGQFAPSLSRSPAVTAGTRRALSSDRVPSFSHELVVELFRNQPLLARELLERCFDLPLPGDAAELGSNDLSQLTPVEYRADNVVLLRADDRITCGVIVEVQLRPDPDKRRTWPLYIAALRATLACPVTLLVIAPDVSVAAWAREPIALGHPGFELVPLVLDDRTIPRVTDPDDAARCPELAVLSTLAHRDPAIASTAAAAIERLPEDPRELYLDVIATAVPGVLNMSLKNYEFQSEPARKQLAQARDLGREEGRQHRRAIVLALARAKATLLPDDLETRLDALHDDAVLDELAIELGRAADADTSRRARATPPAGRRRRRCMTPSAPCTS